MLVDVQFRRPGPVMSTILGAIGDGRIIPERLDQGMYLSSHWSIDQFGVPIRERWKDGAPCLDFDEYGVCDTPEQVVEHLKLNDRPEKFFVSFVKIKRETQPQRGGWRWHKWGPYIGTKSPQCEYLHDEPEIETVYTYHIYEMQS